MNIRHNVMIQLACTAIATAMLLSLATAAPASLGGEDELSQDYWVDASEGDDANGDGTQVNPWKTITHAVSTVNTQDATISVVNVKPGTYNAALGERFPIAIPQRVYVRGTSTFMDLVIDAENNAANVISFSDADDSGIEGASLRNSTGAAISVVNGSSDVVMRKCSFKQSQESNSGANALNIDSAGGVNSVVLDDCSFENLGGRKFVIKLDGKNSSLLAKNCLFADNTVKSFVSNKDSVDYGNRCGTIFSSDGNVITLEDCVFRGNSTYPVKCVPPHDSCNASVIYCGSCQLSFDRCMFVGNTGDSLFGISHDTTEIRNSLFVDNAVQTTMQCGFNARIYWRNSTFIRNTGGYASYHAQLSEFDNCIFYMDGPASVRVDSPSWNDSQRNGTPGAICFVNTVRYNSPDGLGYDAVNSMILVDNPLLENADVAWNVQGFDARPRPQSYVIDASKQENVSGAKDVDGNARSVDNNDDGAALADLGCYESLFRASSVPTFEVPVPGSVSGIRGATLIVPVTISPAPDPDAAVTASVSYGQGISGPATISFASGVTTANLSLTITADCPAETRFTLSVAGDTGIVSSKVDVYASDIVVTVGGKTNYFIRHDDTIDLALALSLAGASAPASIPFTVSMPTGEGSNVIEWTGDSFIAQGAHVAGGQLTVRGGIGENSVEITLAGVGKFLETGTSSVRLDFTGYPGYLFVRPGAGTDAVGFGYAEGKPLNSVSFATAVAKAGDEIRILPGIYGSDVIAFPINSLGLVLKGWNSSGDANPADVVLDGRGEVANLFVFQGSAPSAVANLSLRNSTDAAIVAESSSLTVSNCVFTQSAVDYDKAGAVELRAGSSVSAMDSAFTNMSRRAVVYCRYSGLDNARFVANRCRFAGNNVAYSTLAGDVHSEYDNEGYGNEVASFTLVDTDFIGNKAVTPEGRRDYLSDYYRSSVISGRSGGTISINRCRFISNDGFHCFGVSWYRNFEISNSLFVGNTGSQAMFHGYQSFPNFHNCTMVGNSGGYGAMEVMSAFYDSIIVNDGTLHFGSTGTKSDGSPLGIWGGYVKLVNTILWGTTVDQEHPYSADSTPILADPKLKNITADVKSKTFMPMPLRGSPAIDASLSYNAESWGDKDAYGKPRFTGSGASPAADLGALEYDSSLNQLIIIVR